VLKTNSCNLPSLQPLSKLQVLHAWGSALTNDGAALLPHLFPTLETLSLAWTDVTRVPDLPLLTSLDMSQCTVDSLFQNASGNASAKPLRELILAGASLHHPADWPELPHLHTLDLSGGKAHPDYFFCGRFSSTLTSLNLSNTPAKDSVWGLVSLVQGAGSVVPLRWLRLEGGKGLDEEEMSLRSDVLLSGKLANLEELSVSGWDSGDRNWASVAEALPHLRSLDLQASSDQGKVV
jgi:Leucine-rich repeat (LRR) protein